jgi:hypothetical protein
MNGLRWTLGMHNTSSVKGLLAVTDSASGAGDNIFAVDCSDTTGLNLPGGQFAHFLVQFEGEAGITNVYVNGTSATDTGSTSWWYMNDRDSFTVNARVMSMRNFGGQDDIMDDFAVIPGVVTQTQVDSIRTLGVAGSGIPTAVHYTLDETSGSTIADSSGHGLNGTLVGFDNNQTREPRSVTPSMVPGVFGTALEIGGADFWRDHARIATPTNMPHLGEALTAMFWLKADKWNWNAAFPTASGGAGILFAQNLDGFGLTIGPNDSSVPDSLLVRTAGAGGAVIDLAGVATGGLTDQQWAHFAITIDEAGMITGIFVNGTPGTATADNGWFLGEDGEVSLGCRMTGGNPAYPLDCEVDDFALIRGMLTEAQIGYAMIHGVEGLYTDVIQIPGDATGNGVVDAADAARLANNWGTSAGATWEMGDFNEDGAVNAADASIMAANWGYGTSEAGQGSVPEPGMAALLLGAAVGALAMRRRRTY